MPKTLEEKKTLRHFKEEYKDPKKAKEVYFALRNKSPKFDRSQGGGYSSKKSLAKWWVERLEKLPVLSVKSRVLQRLKFQDPELNWWLQRIQAVKAGHEGYLITDKEGNKHLPTHSGGKPNHRLMGGAWAALHEGYRGNKYEGPNKSQAISKLAKLYEREGLKPPTSKSQSGAPYPLPINSGLKSKEKKDFNLKKKDQEVKIPPPSHAKYFNGIRVVIENPKGSQRHWTDHHTGEKGTTTMLYDYGYFPDNKGLDKDEVDCYLGNNETSPYAFVVKQLKLGTNKMDEVKCMMGFNNPEEARAAYEAHYNKKGFFGGITVWPIDKFQAALRDSLRDPTIIKSLVT
jgi:hypothetical protein